MSRSLHCSDGIRATRTIPQFRYNSIQFRGHHTYFCGAFVDGFGIWFLVPYRSAQGRLKLGDEVVIAQWSARTLLPPNNFALGIRKVGRKKSHPLWYQLQQSRHLYQLIVPLRQMSCRTAPGTYRRRFDKPRRTGLSSTRARGHFSLLDLRRLHCFESRRPTNSFPTPLLMKEQAQNGKPDPNSAC